MPSKCIFETSIARSKYRKSTSCFEYFLMSWFWDLLGTVGSHFQIFFHEYKIFSSDFFV